MKYLKKYESGYANYCHGRVYTFETGEYAVCINEPLLMTANIKLKKGEKYKIINQDKISLTISDKDGNTELFLKLHFLPEIEFDSQKYNL